MPHVMCYEVWHLVTAAKSYAQAVLAHCPVKMQLLQQIVQTDKPLAFSC